MSHIISPDDIKPFADIPDDRLAAMIADAEALAVRAAPCLVDPVHPSVTAAAKAILRGAIVRWYEAGTGAVVQQTSGPFSQTVDTKAARRGMFWPSEITELQSLCKRAENRAFSFTPAGAGDGDHTHYDACDVFWGRPWCSCGSDLNNWRGPLWPRVVDHDPYAVYGYRS